MRRSETVTFGTPPVITRSEAQDLSWRNTGRFPINTLRDRIRTTITPKAIPEDAPPPQSQESQIQLPPHPHPQADEKEENPMKKSQSLLMVGNNRPSRPKSFISKGSNFNIFKSYTLRNPTKMDSESSSPEIHEDSGRFKGLLRTTSSKFTFSGSLAPRLHKQTLNSLFTVIPHTQQQKVVKEILFTEADFVDDCDIIINVYMAYLQRILSVSSLLIKDIFTNILEIRYANQEFLQELQSIIPSFTQNPNKCPDIGRIFATIPSRFACYEIYLAKHDASMQALKDLRASNKEAADVLQSCASHPDTEKLNLESFLIKPIQRLCKYPLLLNELMKCTTDNTQVFVCQNAKMEIESFISHANDKLKNREKMVQIQKYLGKNEYITLLLEGRTITKEGRILQIKKEQAHEKYFWVLDNCVLWCNIQRKSILPQKFQKTHKRMIPLINVVSVIPTELPNFSNTFSVLYTDDKNKQKTLVLAADSYLEKLLWVQTLEKYL